MCTAMCLGENIVETSLLKGNSLRHSTSKYMIFAIIISGRNLNGRVFLMPLLSSFMVQIVCSISMTCYFFPA